MEQTPKEKAQELVDKYKYFVNGYLGSSMLTNTEYPEIILLNAKQCALIAVEEILNGSRLFYIEDYDYWQEVKQELIKSE